MKRITLDFTRDKVITASVAFGLGFMLGALIL